MKTRSRHETTLPSSSRPHPDLALRSLRDVKKRLRSPRFCIRVKGAVTPHPSAESPAPAQWTNGSGRPAPRRGPGARYGDPIVSGLRRTRVRMTRRRKLSTAALAFRGAHAAVAAAFLLAIGYVWWCALSGRRGPLLGVAVMALAAEGALVVANRGDCPLGGLQERLGDPVPLFELVLSPRAARRAVPILGAVAAAGVVLVARGCGARSAARSPARPPCASAIPRRTASTSDR